jgi:hypothetical protein
MPLAAAVTRCRCGPACEFAVVPMLDGVVAAASAPADTSAGRAFAGTLFVLDAQDAAALERLS